MSNLVFNKFKAENAKGNVDLDDAGTVIRALLVRDTSAYTPNADHDFLDAFTGGGGVEISVASYARQTLASKAVNEDDGNDRAEFDANDIAFGELESGQTVEALLIYKQVGGDDTTPEDDILIAWIDTASGAVEFPFPLNGAPVTITIDAEGLLQLS